MKHSRYEWTVSQGVVFQMKKRRHKWSVSRGTVSVAFTLSVLIAIILLMLFWQAKCHC